MDSQETSQNCNLCYCICCKRQVQQRHILTILLVLAPVILYIHRTCLSLAIKPMTKWVNPVITHEAICGGNTTRQVELITELQFDWDQTVQSYILLSFYLGYCVGSFFIGCLINRFGGRKCLAIGALTSSIMTIIIPPLALYTHWGFLCVTRILAGFGQSALYASAQALINRWILEERKSSTATMVMLSSSAGMIIGNFSTGYIIRVTQTWSYIFYLFGILGLVWVLFFFFYGYSFPQTHPHISPTELKLLEAIPKPRRTAIPFKQILGDCGVWIYILGFLGSFSTFFLIVTNIPKYFMEVLGYNSYVAGMILMGPPAAGAIGGLSIGYLGDYLISNNYVKKKTYRAICTTIGIPAPPICLLMMVLMKCNYTAASILVSLSFFLHSAYYTGAGMMAVDLTLNYAGLVVGYANVAVGISGALVPYMVGFVAYNNTFTEWRVVLYITILVAVFAWIPYLMFFKVERSSWDYSEEEVPPPEDNAPIHHKIWSCYKRN